MSTVHHELMDLSRLADNLLLYAWCISASGAPPDALFPMLPIIDDPREFGDVLRWSIDNPEARADAAMKAREAVADRTFDRTAAELLRQSGI